MRLIILPIITITFLLSARLACAEELTQTDDEAELAIKAIKSGNYQKIEKAAKQIKYIPLKQALKKLLIEKLLEEGELNRLRKMEIKDPYQKLRLAKLLSAKGNPGECKSIMKELFKNFNFLDEDIIINYPGNRKELMEDTVLLKKVRIALSERDLEKANLYLNLISDRENPEYKLLKAKLFAKTDTQKAIELLNTIDTPEATALKIYLCKEPLLKYINAISLLSENGLDNHKKKQILEYCLEKLLSTDLALFRKLVEKVKNFDEKLYTEYRIKYLVRTFDIEEALKELSNQKSEKFKAWKYCIEKIFLKRAKSFNSNRLSFYTFMLSEEKPQIIWHEPSTEDIKNKTIRKLLATGKCDLISILESNEIDIALANYMCGNYEKSIKIAIKHRNEHRNHDLVMSLLFPRPATFGNDILSLAIARQESLFNSSAISRSGAIGIMQIMPATGKYIAHKMHFPNFKKHLLIQERLNYSFGSYYIKELSQKFGCITLAVASYNAGPGRIEKYLEQFGNIQSGEDAVIFVDFFIPIKETREYVKKVIKNYYIYSYMMNGKYPDLTWSCHEENTRH